jgi:hypothetical protein
MLYFAFESNFQRPTSMSSEAGEKSIAFWFEQEIVLRGRSASARVARGDDV